MIIIENCKIIDNKEIAPSFFKLSLANPKIAALTKPFQFLTLNFDKNSSLILPRPFSIYEKNSESISIIYKVIGKGTELLSTLKPETPLLVKAPLGNSVKLPKKNLKIALVAGGVGIASLRLFALSLKNNFDLFYGSRSNIELLELESWQKLATQVFVTTDDGSNGKKGFITEVLKNKILDYDLIYACGPRPMLSKISAIAKENHKPHFLVMEEIMACGVGLCMSCALETTNGIKRICKDGPVFDGDLLSI